MVRRKKFLIVRPPPSLRHLFTAWRSYKNRCEKLGHLICEEEENVCQRRCVAPSPFFAFVRKPCDELRARSCLPCLRASVEALFLAEETARSGGMFPFTTLDEIIKVNVTYHDTT